MVVVNVSNTSITHMSAVKTTKNSIKVVEQTDTHNPNVFHSSVPIYLSSEALPEGIKPSDVKGVRIIVEYLT